MGEILVSNVCARRLSAAGNLFLRGASARARVSACFHRFCALFFICSPLFPASAAFLPSQKELALLLARIFHCRSTVFFPKKILDCTPLARHETRDWLRSQQLTAGALPHPRPRSERHRHAEPLWSLLSMSQGRVRKTQRGGGIRAATPSRPGPARRCRPACRRSAPPAARSGSPR